MINKNFSIYINGKEVKAANIMSYHDKNGRNCLKVSRYHRVVTFEQDEHNVLSIESQHGGILFAGKYAKDIDIDRIDIINIKGLDFMDSAYVRFKTMDDDIYKLNVFDYTIREMEKIKNN